MPVPNAPSPTTMLYRPASDPHPDMAGMKAEYEIVPKEEVEARLADGWYRSPGHFPAEGAKADVPAAPLSLLNETAEKIIETLPALTKDEIGALLKAETEGKARKGVIAALEKAAE